MSAWQASREIALTKCAWNDVVKQTEIEGTWNGRAFRPFALPKNVDDVGVPGLQEDIETEVFDQIDRALIDFT
jgi:hypothetical protein